MKLLFPLLWYKKPVAGLVGAGGAMEDQRSRRMWLFDVGLVAWVVLWVALGAVTFLQVRGLESLSDTMDAAGQTMAEAGRGLGAIASIPLVGAGVRPAAERVQGLAKQTVTSAAESRSQIRGLGVLAVIFIGVFPPLFGVAAYVPLRRYLVRASRG